MDYHEFFREQRNHKPLTADNLADAIESLLDEIDETIEELDREKEDRQMSEQKLTSAFDDSDETIEIHAPHWQAHEMVTARIVPTVEDEEIVNNAVIHMKKDAKKQGMDFESQIGATRRLWLERLILSWTFTKRGTPVPFSGKAIKALPTHYADYIYDEIMKCQPTLSEEEEADFLESSETTTEEEEKSPSHLKAGK